MPNRTYVRFEPTLWSKGKTANFTSPAIGFDTATVRNEEIRTISAMIAESYGLVDQMRDLGLRVDQDAVTSLQTSYAAEDAAATARFAADWQRSLATAEQANRVVRWRRVVY